MSCPAGFVMFLKPSWRSHDSRARCDSIHGQDMSSNVPAGCPLHDPGWSPDALDVDRSSTDVHVQADISLGWEVCGRPWNSMLSRGSPARMEPRMGPQLANLDGAATGRLAGHDRNCARHRKPHQQTKSDITTWGGAECCGRTTGLQRIPVSVVTVHDCALPTASTHELRALQHSQTRGALEYR